MVDAVGEVRLVIGGLAHRIGEFEGLHRRDQHRVAVFGLLEQQLLPKYGVAHCLDLRRERKVEKRPETGVKRERMEAQIETVQHADRPGRDRSEEHTSELQSLMSIT